MAITLEVPVDPLVITQLIDDGFTSLRLWYASEPDGTYTDSAVTASPSTLADAIEDESYTFTFVYTGGNALQWFKVRAYDGSVYSDSFLSSPFNGGAGVSLKYLRRRLGQMLNDMTVCTTTSSGDANTANCTQFAIRRWPDSHFNGHFLYRVGTGESAIVDSSTQAGALNFSPDNGTTVGSSEELEVTRQWTYDEYVKAINWACVAAYPTLSRTIVHTGVQSSDESYLYSVPQDILTLASVEIESETNLTSTEPNFRGQPWQQVPFVPIYEGIQLKFELQHPERDERRMRITGIGYLSQMASDTDAVELLPHNADLLLALAASRLWNLKSMAAPSSDRDYFVTNAQQFRAMYEEGKASARSKRKPQRLWGSDALKGGARPFPDPRRDGLAP